MISYRKDIDGLRAIAVLSILVFHINKSWLPGGFVGVDIFFVISGFLITSIIHKQMLDGTFTLTDFYNRRIKRIVPAAMFYTILIVITTYFIYLPNDFLVASKSAIASTVFLSNIYFMRNFGYFSPQAEENPLLHTWSLAVEEQFYVIWPILLLGLIKWIKSSHSTLWLLISLMVAAFATAHFLALTPATQKIAFYLMPTRFGEFLIGSILAMNLTRLSTDSLQYKNGFAFTGIAILLTSFVLIDEDTLFPGFYALMVCLGTALIIVANAALPNHKPGFVALIMSSKPFRYVGKISFSLYLAHWPALAIARYLTQSYELNLTALIWVVGATFLMAHLTWKYVEMPFRKAKLTFFKATFAFYLLPALMIVMISVHSLTTDGAPGRFNKADKNFKVASEAICVTHIREDCEIGHSSTNKTKFLLVGDSHGSFYSSMLDALGRSQNFSLDAISVNDCAGVFTFAAFNNGSPSLAACNKLKAYVKKQVQSERYSGFIYAERWEVRLFKSNSYLDELTANLEQLEKQGKTVFLLLQVPKYDCDLNRVILLRERLGSPSNCSLVPNPKVHKANKKLRALAAQYDHVTTLSVNDYFCQTVDQCSVLLENEIAYADDDHLSIRGAEILASKIAHDMPEPWQGFIRRLKN